MGSGLVCERTISRSTIAYACGMSRAHTKYLPNNVLKVEGVLYSTICSSTLPASQNFEEALEAIQTWKPKSLETNDYASGESMADAYLSTLRMGYLKEQFPFYEVPSLEEWRQIYTQAYSCHSPTVQPKMH